VNDHGIVIVLGLTIPQKASPATGVGVSWALQLAASELSCVCRFASAQ